MAFAGNSVLCRLALKNTEIGAIEFTLVRILSGCLVLLPILLVAAKGGQATLKSGSKQAVALFIYALFFSLAYVRLEAGTGAWILFAAVQITMIGISIIKRTWLSLREWIGLIFTLSGVVYLNAPSLNSPHFATPTLLASCFMFLSGVAWGLYSFWGQTSSNASFATARNFLLATPLALIAFVGLILSQGDPLWTIKGVILAAISGAVTSGLGYLIWYIALKGLSLSTAAILQLTVPLIAALGGVVFVDEQISSKLIISSALILGGILLYMSRGFIPKKPQTK